MDFSEVLQNEINKKRKDHKVNASKSLRKSRKDNANRKVTTDDSKEITALATVNNVSQEQEECSNTGTAIQNADNDGLALNGHMSESNDEKDLANIQAKYDQYAKQLELESKTDKVIIYEDIFDEGSSEKICLQIRIFLKDLIKRWDLAVNRDSAASMNGISSSAIRVNTYSDPKILHEAKLAIVPLLYKLRSNTLSRELIVTLALLARHVQRKEFREANEGYMKLSIGNSAWPVGVKSIGIHESSNTSKITGVNGAPSANIMKTEKTRRWIIAVKRLITFAEQEGAL